MKRRQPAERRPAAAEEVEALAREIASDHAIGMDAARELARRSLKGLLAYADQWEQWAAERRQVRRPPTA